MDNINLENQRSVLFISDIQRILNIGRVQAYQLANSGQFHTVRIGKSIRIDKEVFFRWLKGEELKKINNE